MITLQFDERELKELHDFWNERILSSSPAEPKMQAVEKRLRQMIFKAYRAQVRTDENAEALRVVENFERAKGAS